MRKEIWHVCCAYKRMFGSSPPKDYVADSFKRTMSKPNRGKRIRFKV